MPIINCLSELGAVALIALLLLPAPYYVSELYPRKEQRTQEPLTLPTQTTIWSKTFAHFPQLDVFVTVSLAFIGLFSYLSEWIQRKLLERRMFKLNEDLGVSVNRLQTWNMQEEQIESTLKMVQNACSEYGLLLYILLRQQQNQPIANAFTEHMETVPSPVYEGHRQPNQLVLRVKAEQPARSISTAERYKRNNIHFE